MRKDKPKSKITLEDVKHQMEKEKREKVTGSKTIFMNENQSYDIPEIKWDANKNKQDEKQQLINSMNEKAIAENDKARIYNDNIHEVATIYSEFVPVSDLLLRAFVKPVENNNGIIIYDLRDKIPILANAQNAPHHFIDNPYNYQTKAIVVSVPDNERFFKPGQIVSIPQSLVRAPIPMNEYLEVSYGFTHPDYLYLEPPRNKEDIHFGYLLMPRNLIKGFINETREIIKNV